MLREQSVWFPHRAWGKCVTLGVRCARGKTGKKFLMLAFIAPGETEGEGQLHI